MTIAVPAPIQKFIDATNAGDNAGFLDSFAEDATLSDWGRHFRGHREIAQWNLSDNIGVKSRFHLVSIEGGAADYRVIMVVRGEGFNGRGRMTFSIGANHIQTLVIS